MPRRDASKKPEAPTTKYHSLFSSFMMMIPSIIPPRKAIQTQMIDMFLYVWPLWIIVFVLTLISILGWDFY